MMVNTFRKKTFDTTQLGSLHLLGNSNRSRHSETASTHPPSAESMPRRRPFDGGVRCNGVFHDRRKRFLADHLREPRRMVIGRVFLEFALRNF